MQQLKVSLTIPIPSDSVIIKKVELEELKNLELTGVYWNMKDLEKRISKSDRWIKENILYPTRFKKYLIQKMEALCTIPKAKDKRGAFKLLEWPSFWTRIFI